MPDTPYHPIVAEMLAALNEQQREAVREAFEERAAILEFDAGLDRNVAEALALLEVIRLHGWPSAQK